MIKVFFVLSFLFVFSPVVFAQATNQAEAKWETYAFKEGFSVSLPKLPIVVNTGNWLISEDTKRFGAYTNGTAYVVSRSQKLEDRLPKDPAQKPFSKNNFQLRLVAIRKDFEDRQEKYDETKLNENDWQVFHFTGAETIYKLYYNSKNNDWIELWTIRPNESQAEVANFFASFKVEKNPQGKEISDGANATIGDLPPAKPANNTENSTGSGTALTGKPNELPKPLNENSNIEIQKLRIILKPRANYTEESRKNQISGTVRVRAIFSANGNVSSVFALNGLPYGLTEEAISAARKILFVPKKRNGIRVSVAKVMEYNFNLY